MMRILIDADGCPVVDIAVSTARRFGIEAIILCDTSHIIEKVGARTITVSKGSDSVDFALVNMVSSGDIVVTQDYGLAAMALAKKARPISQDGLVFHSDNIDALLLARHTARRIRSSGGRLRGPSRRTDKQDAAFEAALCVLLSEPIP